MKAFAISKAIQLTLHINYESTHYQKHSIMKRNPIDLYMDDLTNLPITAESTDSEMTDSACRFRGIDQNSTKIWPIPHNHIMYIRGIGQWVPESARGYYQEKKFQQNNKIHTFSRLSVIFLQNLRESPFRTVYVDCNLR